MGTIATTQPILERAKRCEAEYNWPEAAALYEKTLAGPSSDNAFQAGDLSEKAGHAYYKAALQVGTRDAFDDKIRSAISSYNRAGEFYARAGSDRPRELRSRAMVAFLNLWIAPKPSERRRLIEEAWVLANEALQTLNDRDDPLEYLSSYNQLSQIPAFVWLNARTHF
jgi:hypothetical protein